MDPKALLVRFAKTTRNDRAERLEMVDNYHHWVNNGGFKAHIRHKNDPASKPAVPVLGVCFRGVHTYFVTGIVKDESGFPITRTMVHTSDYEVV